MNNDYCYYGGLSIRSSGMLPTGTNPDSGLVADSAYNFADEFGGYILYVDTHVTGYKETDWYNQTSNVNNLKLQELIQATVTD